MSIGLNNGTRPKDLEAKMQGGWGNFPQTVHLTAQGIDLEISMGDFVALTCYVLLCTDLDPDGHPLLCLVEWVKTLQVEVKSPSHAFNHGNARLRQRQEPQAT